MNSAHAETDPASGGARKPGGHHLIVHVDGGARGNPGPAAAAAVITTPDGEPVTQLGIHLGEATNNVAEYRALLLGIQLAGELGAAKVELIGDSELVVKQIRGEYKVKDENLRKLHAQALALLADLPGWTIRHVARKHNAAADKLVNETLDAAE